MTWQTCDPSRASEVCPERSCERNTICDTDGQYETDCVAWCENMIECVTLNSECISEQDPLCFDNYDPRDPCIDYIDSNMPQSKGPSGQSNYATSWGSKAAIDLLTCACGGG